MTGRIALLRTSAHLMTLIAPGSASVASMRMRSASHTLLPPTILRRRLATAGPGSSTSVPVRPLNAVNPSFASGLLTSAGVIGAINLAGFAATAALDTHKITDLLGTGAFVASAAVTSWKTQSWRSPRALALNLCVGVWGTRLASFLFYRILNTGEDKRLSTFFPKKGEKWFDKNGANFPVGLAGFWTIQALWAWIVSVPVTLVNYSPLKMTPLGWGGWLSVAGFAVGFLFEAVADLQKYVFKQKPENKDRFISTGLWSLSRHPNYFGEMVVWWAVYGLALPALPAAQAAAALASPGFISLLLLKVTGIPPLEAKYDRVYKNDPAYQAYKETTPLLVPKPIGRP